MSVLFLTESAPVHNLHNQQKMHLQTLSLTLLCLRADGLQGRHTEQPEGIHPELSMMHPHPETLL